MTDGAVTEQYTATDPAKPVREPNNFEYYRDPINEHGALEIDRSESVGDLTIDIPSVSLTSIPNIAPGDSVIYTEAFLLHQAFVPVFGLDYITCQRDSAHRPRFVGRIAWQR